MKMFWILAFAALLSASMCNANQTEKAKLTGPQLRASAVALEDFLKGADAPDLDKFSVEIFELDDSYEVVFVPNQLSGQPTVRGGETVFGKEVHYLISKNSNKIIRKSFAR
jgi:hypothetical protein